MVSLLFLRLNWKKLGAVGPGGAATVSRVAKTLDAAVAAFHKRPLGDAYRVLMLDGVVLARKTAGEP
jgi:transposase-like protein